MNNAEKFKQLFGIYATELWATPEVDFLKWLNEKVQLIQEDTTSDPIDRQATIDALEKSRFPGAPYIDTGIQIAMREIKALPSAQPEPSIPLSWIEGQIEWLRSLDDAFASMTAGQISAMVEKWKGEQESR